MTSYLPLIALAILWQGLDPSLPRHTAPLADYLSLSVETDRDVYYRGELLVLQLTAENTSQTAVTAFLTLDPILGNTRVFHRPPGGEFVELPGLVHGRLHGMVDERTLKPGEKHNVEVELSVTAYPQASRKFILDTVGRHDLKVVYFDTVRDPNGTLESNVVSVDVVAPPASESAAGAAYTADLAYAAQFRGVGRRGWSYLSPEETRAAADFIRRFPDSRYAAAVKEGLRRSLDYRQRIGHATEEEKALWKQLFQDTLPPVLTVQATPAKLWPPNGKMTPVSVQVSVRDDQDPNPEIRLVSITCDDNCNPTIDVANATPDTDDRLFELRSERQGTGAGRTYTISYSAQDASGNRAIATSTVVVPHDQSKK